MLPLVLAGCTIASESTSWTLCRKKTIQNVQRCGGTLSFETCHDGRYQVRQFDELSRIPYKLWDQTNKESPTPSAHWMHAIQKKITEVCLRKFFQLLSMQTWWKLWPSHCLMSYSWISSANIKVSWLHQLHLSMAALLDLDHFDKLW